MEELIKEYIEKTYEYTIDNLIIDIDGAVCLAKYTISEYGHESEHKKINIWDMMSFLNAQKLFHNK